MVEEVLSERFQHIDPDVNLFNINNQPCNYFSLEDFNKASLSHSIYNSCLLNYNIRSFHAQGRKANFESLLSSLASYPSFIVLTETWNTTDNILLCNLEGYHVEHTFRVSSVGGGVSIFCLNEFKIEKLNELSLCNDFIETCTIQMDIGTTSIIVIGIYRPPSSPVDSFIEALESIICNQRLNNRLVLIAGDMNLNLSNTDNLSINHYLSTLNSYFFVPVINKPTRFPPNNTDIRPSTLDHIFININYNTWAGIIYWNDTDHLPTFIKFKLSMPSEANLFRKIQFRSFSQSNLNSLISSVSNIDWDTLFSSEDVDTNVKIFTKTLNDAYCKFFPIKTKYLSEKRLSKPWLTTHILQMIKTKSNYYKNYKSGLISKTVSNNMKNRVDKYVREAKNNYFIQKLNSFKNNAKKTFKTIILLTGQNKPRDQLIKLVNNENIITNETDIAEIMNNYFANVATTLDSKIPNTTLSPLTYLNYDPHCSFFLHNTCDSEIVNIISNLKLTRSELNFLPVYVFKQLGIYLTYPLTKLINLCFRSGLFPSSLKIARITPIHKKGSKDLAENFRPISSLPYLSKLFERCIANRLISFFDSTSLLSKFQFGFQRGKSTGDALRHLLKGIYTSLNERKHHASVLIDLTKAFDCVNHSILLNKMEAYGIKGTSLNIFKTYLSNRQSFVRMGTNCSSIKTTNIGVPQESILGPILFILYINDLPNVSRIIQPIMFADDTTLSTSHFNYGAMVDELNAELEKINLWCVSNRLTLNTKKTELILFTKKCNTVSDNQIALGNEILVSNRSCVFLGIRLDDQLKFSSHIQFIISKLSKSLGILYKIRDSLPIQTRINYYYAYMYPYISYNITSWGGTNQIHLHPLIILHKRIIRTICGNRKFDHTAPLFHKLRFLKLYDIFRYFVSVYMHGAVRGGMYDVPHHINTRNRDRALPKFHRLNVCQQSISYTGPNIWNNLPSDLRNIESLSLLKNKLKKFFVGQYI